MPDSLYPGLGPAVSRSLPGPVRPCCDCCPDGCYEGHLTPCGVCMSEPAPVDVYCAVCGHGVSLLAEPCTAEFRPETETWRCTDEAACGLRAVDNGGWCDQPHPGTGVGCQRPSVHPGDRHAAITIVGGKILVKEW